MPEINKIDNLTMDDVNEEMDTVTLEPHGNGVLELRLDRRRRMNALSEEMLSDLAFAAEFVDSDPPGALVVTASGRRAFSIGLDPDIFEKIQAADRPAQFFNHALDTPLGKFTSTIEHMEAPVIGAIHGPAYGGGSEIAIATDVRIAGESAEFAQPEINLGFPPTGGATQRLPALIGESRAKEMMFTTDSYDAETLAEWGLFYRVVDDEDVKDEAFELAEELAENPGAAYGAVKRAIRVHNNRDYTGFDLERVYTEDLFLDAEYSEM